MRLGIGARTEQGSLAVRLAWFAAARLFTVIVFFGILTTFYLGGFSLDRFSGKIALFTIAGAFAISALFGLFLRRGKHLAAVARTQLVADPLLWTVIVYISGGASSGATSLYGLSCLAGAVILGRQGALIAALSSAIFYSLLCTAFMAGVVSYPPDQPAAAYATAWQDVRYPFFVNLLAIFVVTLLASYLAERLRLTGGRLEMATARAEQAERLAALGTLAAGLAHEIRNPLGAIAASVELLRAGDSLSEEEQKLCEIVERETARLNELVSDMLDLSRPRAPQKSHVDLGAVTSDVVTLASKSGRGLDVNICYEGPGQVTVFADAAQIRQVVWNLLRNAVQASSAGDTVAVRIGSSAQEIVLEVCDHGPGISKEARARLFDAFFTTRSKGMGIGLAVVKRIIDDHEFSIEVESIIDKGTTFRIRIPLDSDTI